MRFCTLGCIVILFITLTGGAARANKKSLSDSILDYLAHSRQRRTLLKPVYLKGMGALKRLLKEARHLYSNGYDSVFMKYGDYDNAVDDFFSVKPTAVREFVRQGEEIKQGRVGSVQLFLRQPPNDFPTLTVHVPDDMVKYHRDPRVQKIIIYSKSGF